MPGNHDSHSEVIAKSAALTEVFTEEKFAYMLSLCPNPESLGTDHNRYEATYTASLKGDPEKVKACEAERVVMNQNLTILHGIAKILSVKDPTVMEKLGFGKPPEKAAASSHNIDSPHGFKVFFDPQGNLFANVGKVEGAKGYELWVCDGDPNVESNWRLALFSLSCKRLPITGLNRTKVNWFKIRGIRGNTTGPWSYFQSVNPA
ncbi:hypothetical protein [Citrifermentans bremense]|uniref:hypothetical protein n=1 Tax=Citrifermentans bremense TaxID=60035 RepID=UPI00040CA386|nr:hypothetical protein [Citrifermentans bremense]